MMRVFEIKLQTRDFFTEPLCFQKVYPDFDTLPEEKLAKPGLVGHPSDY